MKKHHLLWLIVSGVMGWFVTQGCFPIAQIAAPPPAVECFNEQSQMTACAQALYCRDKFGDSVECPR